MNRNKALGITLISLPLLTLFAFIIVVGGWTALLAIGIVFLLAGMAFAGAVLLEKELD